MTPQRPRRPPAQKEAEVSGPVRGVRTAAAGVTALFAAISATFGVLAYVLAPHVDPAALGSEKASTGVLSEPYLLSKKVKEAYEDQMPRAVALTLEEFNTDARTDLQEATQDFQRRHAPEPICAEHARAVRAIYGPRGCEKGSAFYTTSRKYERGLIVWSARGDPVDGHSIALTPAEMKVAFKRMRAAESAVIGCSVTNHGKYALTVEVSPDPGFVVMDGQATFTLDPGATRPVLLRPGDEMDAPLGTQPGCTFDRTLASKEQGKPYPLWAIVLATGFALLAALAAAVLAWKKPLG